MLTIHGALRSLLSQDARGPETKRFHMKQALSVDSTLLRETLEVRPSHLINVTLSTQCYYTVSSGSFPVIHDLIQIWPGRSDINFDKDNGSKHKNTEV